VKGKLGGKRNYVCQEKLNQMMMRLLECTLLYDGDMEPLVESGVHFEGDGNGTERINKPMRMTAEETLIKQYGPLLSISQLAVILDRSPDGLRITLKSSGEWVNKINATLLRLGRRLYFRAVEVADVLGIR
jgi:hypothetical protein